MRLVLKSAQRTALDLVSSRRSFVLLACGIVLSLLVALGLFGSLLLRNAGNEDTWRWHASGALQGGDFASSPFASFLRGAASSSLVATDNLGRRYPIDAVITWVNGSDPIWLKELLRYKRLENDRLAAEEGEEGQLGALAGEEDDLDLDATGDDNQIAVLQDRVASELGWNRTVSAFAVSALRLSSHLLRLTPGLLPSAVEPLSQDNEERFFHELWRRSSPRQVPSLLLRVADKILANATGDLVAPLRTLKGDLASLSRLLELVSLSAAATLAANGTAGQDQHQHQQLFASSWPPDADTLLWHFKTLPAPQQAEADLSTLLGIVKEQQTLQKRRRNGKSAKEFRREREELAEVEGTMNRYRDNEELKFLLRSLERYAPWIRQIFLVTNGQVPSWLDISASKIKIATHAEIFPNPAHLPVFSSPSIEAHLHRIEGLSERWLYFNDDTMLGSETFPDDFLTNAQGQKVYLSWEVPKCSPGCLDNWLADGFCDSACNNTRCGWDFGDCLGNATKAKGSSVSTAYSGANYARGRGRPGYAHNAAGGKSFFGSGSTAGLTSNSLASAALALSAASTDLGYSVSASHDSQCNTGCPDSWLGDKMCDGKCNNLNCGYDAGDCGITRVVAETPGATPTLLLSGSSSGEETASSNDKAAVDNDDHSKPFALESLVKSLFFLGKSDSKRVEALYRDEEEDEYGLGAGVFSSSPRISILATLDVMAPEAASEQEGTENSRNNVTAAEDSQAAPSFMTLVSTSGSVACDVAFFALSSSANATSANATNAAASVAPQADTYSPLLRSLVNCSKVLSPLLLPQAGPLSVSSFSSLLNLSAAAQEASSTMASMLKPSGSDTAAEAQDQQSPEEDEGDEAPPIHLETSLSVSVVGIRLPRADLSPALLPAYPPSMLPTTTVKDSAAGETCWQWDSRKIIASLGKDASSFAGKAVTLIRQPSPEAGDAKQGEPLRDFYTLALGPHSSFLPANTASAVFHVNLSLVMAEAVVIAKKKAHDTVRALAARVGISGSSFDLELKTDEVDVKEADLAPFAVAPGAALRTGIFQHHASTLVLYTRPALLTEHWAAHVLGWPYNSHLLDAAILPAGMRPLNVTAGLQAAKARLSYRTSCTGLRSAAAAFGSGLHRPGWCVVIDSLLEKGGSVQQVPPAASPASAIAAAANATAPSEVGDDDNGGLALLDTVMQADEALKALLVSLKPVTIETATASLRATFSFTASVKRPLTTAEDDVFAQSGLFVESANASYSLSLSVEQELLLPIHLQLPPVVADIPLPRIEKAESVPAEVVPESSLAPASSPAAITISPAPHAASSADAAVGAPRALLETTAEEEELPAPSAATDGVVAFTNDLPLRLRMQQNARAIIAPFRDFAISIGFALAEPIVALFGLGSDPVPYLDRHPEVMRALEAIKEGRTASPNPFAQSPFLRAVFDLSAPGASSGASSAGNAAALSKLEAVAALEKQMAEEEIVLAAAHKSGRIGAKREKKAAALAEIETAVSEAVAAALTPAPSASPSLVAVSSSSSSSSSSFSSSTSTSDASSSPAVPASPSAAAKAPKAAGGGRGRIKGVGSAAAPVVSSSASPSPSPSASPASEDHYGASLIHSNRLITTAFGKGKGGFGGRKTPGHLPHFLQTPVLERLQDTFPHAFAATSRHRFRSSRDLQYAFTYFHFLIEGGGQEALDMKRYWERELDTDNDGYLNENELRTLVAVVLKKAPSNEDIDNIKRCLVKGRANDEEEGEGKDAAKGKAEEGLFMPPISLQVVLDCRTTREGLRKNARPPFGPIKPAQEITNLEDFLAFEMVGDDFNKTKSQLDSVRARKPKFICVNDDMQKAPKETRKLIRDFYLSMLPLPSSFELPSYWVNTGRRATVDNTAASMAAIYRSLSDTEALDTSGFVWRQVQETNPFLYIGPLSRFRAKERVVGWILVTLQVAIVSWLVWTFVDSFRQANGEEAPGTDEVVTPRRDNPEAAATVAQASAHRGGRREASVGSSAAKRRKGE